MSLIGSILSLVGLAPPSEWKGRRGISAKFDAAGVGNDNKRHWANADGLSANAALNPAVRKSLRERSRYEGQNSTFCDGMLDTMARSVVGIGPLLQCWLDDENENEQIENAFGAWAEEIDLAGKLRLAARAKVESGEVFAVLITNPALDHPVKLDIRLVEADQVATPHVQPIDPTRVDGIDYDAAGNPTFYSILKAHPGSGSIDSMSATREPARNVVHYFRPKRPGQGRGYPEIASALPLFAYQRRFELATVQAAETAANIAAVVQTGAPADDEGEEVSPMSTIPLERGVATFLPYGYQIGQVKAEHPTTTFREFMGQLIRSFARAIGLPFNIASGDSSGYNYASGRLDHQTFDELIKIERDSIERIFLRRIMKAWLAEAVLVRGLVPANASAIRGDLSLVSWLWPCREHVDPVKNVTADAMALENGLTTRTAILAKQRIRFRDNAKKLAEEISYLNRLGVPATAKAPVVDPNAPDQQDTPSVDSQSASRQETGYAA